MNNEKKTNYFLRTIGKAAVEGLTDGIQGVRTEQQQRLYDAFNDGFYCSMEKAIFALHESEIDDDTVVKLLINYWDMRKSEAESWVNRVLHQNE